MYEDLVKDLRDPQVGDGTQYTKIYMRREAADAIEDLDRRRVGALSIVHKAIIDAEILGKRIDILEKKYDKAEEVLEMIMEADPRTFENPECDNAWIFDKVHEALMILKYGHESFMQK